MKVLKDPKKMQAWSKKMRLKGKTIGFVATMGYLHQGHLSLMRRARKENDYVVLSIFVNPMQFGPEEDFNSYPRNFRRDEKLAEASQVDVIFYPSTKDIYRKDCRTYVEVAQWSDILCGASRKGHFRGVTTIVLKLFNIIQPDRAYFGQKDAQQAIIIKRMIEDLDLRIKLKILPIVRESDGLAMSSRNTYLSAQQRKNAIIIYKSLQFAVDMIQSGYKSPREIIKQMKRKIRSKPGTRIDYVTIVDSNTLETKEKLKGDLLIAAAVYLGKTRLIDNVKIHV